jgi:small subunit ribosomal protein S6
MREYELMFIVHPDLDENAFNDVVKRISGWITDDGGEVAKTEVWGKRPLAYSIRKQREGQYVLMYAKMSPKLGATLDRNLRYLEPVMRFMLTTK